MHPSDSTLKEVLLLLEDAHQRLLDTHNYGIDLLVYRAMQLLEESPVLQTQESQTAP